jgi:hypothetical protein
VLLAKEDVANMRAITEKADRFMAIHAPQSHDSTVAAMSTTPHSEDVTVAATTASQAAAEEAAGQETAAPPPVNLPSSQEAGSLLLPLQVWREGQTL